MLRLDLDKMPALAGKPLYMPMFRLQGIEIEASARLLVKEDRRAQFDRLVVRNEIHAWLRRDGDRFRVDVHADCAWDAKFWGDEAGMLDAHYRSIVQAVTDPGSRVQPDDAVPMSLKLLAQEITARPNTVVDLVQIKDDLFSLAVTSNRRRKREDNPYLILYYNAADDQVGVEVLKKHYIDGLVNAARCLADVDPVLSGKLGAFKQPTFIDKAKAGLSTGGLGDDASFFAMQYLYAGNPVFFGNVAQSMDAIGAAFRAVGGSIHEVTESIANVGQLAGNFFTDVGHAIGGLFSGGSDDAGGLVIAAAIAVLVAISACVVCIGVLVVQKLMSIAEKASTSMTYYLGKKGGIKKFRPPQIYRDDFF
jgi:hypothetical protein